MEKKGIENKKNKKWFLKWWGIVVIILSLIVLLMVINFVFLVFRYKKAIERGDIIVVGNVVGGYSKFGENLENSEVIINRQELESGNNPSLGEGTAMTMVIFSDFNCPYSAIFYPTVKDFVLEYPEQVKVIFRDFPLSDNQAALAANCAFEQDRFWEMHDNLFNNIENLSDEKIKSIANDLKLDMDLFNDCYDNQKYQEEIQKDLAQGIKAGIEGTPTVFINGKKFAGVIPKTILEQILYALVYGE